VAETVQNDPALQATLTSVIRYSSTVYDVNIADSEGTVVLSDPPGNEGKPLPARTNYDGLRKAGPVPMMMQVFGEPRVLDIVAPLQNNGKLFASVTLGFTLRCCGRYTNRCCERRLADGFVLIAALLAAFLLSNLALRP